MPKKYDVIVIGAGIGGLTAAAILARNGKKVLVLEKNPMAGGYAVNFRRGEFNFDASLHLIDGCELGGEMYERLLKTGVMNKLKFVKPNHIYRSIYPDFDIKVPQRDIQSYIKILSEYFPDEETNIRKLFNEMANIHKDTVNFLNSKVSLGQDLLIFPIKYRKLFFYRKKTFKNMLDLFIKDNKLKTIISQLWCYYGLSPSKLSAFYYSYPTYDYIHNGGYYPEGGGRALTNALLEVIEENGGKVKLNSEIDKIIVLKREAKGIRTKTGNEFLADIIISNIDANKTFFTLVGREHLLESFIAKLDRMDISISAFQVYLGLKIDLRDKGFNDYEIFYNPSYDIESQYQACFSNDVANQFLGIVFYSNVDPTVAPKGKSVVTITALAGYDFWKHLNTEEYRQKKEETARILIKIVEEKIIPNLSSCIEKIEIATPLTMERYTGNSKGAMYGWSQLVSQSGIHRLHYRTPIKNLYLASAWTWTGGGIASVTNAGFLVAKDIL